MFIIITILMLLIMSYYVDKLDREEALDKRNKILKEKRLKENNKG